MDKAEGQLVLLDEARRRLAKVASVDEAKKIRDQAEALRHYAQQQKLGLESQNAAAEIKIRAERRAGELLAEVERLGSAEAGRKGGHVKASTAQAGPCQKTYEQTIEDAWIARVTAQRWQAEALIPEPVFEKFVRVAKDGERELTSAATVRFAKNMMEDPERDASKAARESLAYQWVVHVGRLERIIAFFVEHANEASPGDRKDALKAFDRSITSLRSARKEIAQ